MKKQFLISLLVFICCIRIFSQDIQATTDSGDRVNLYEDGTWTFIEKNMDIDDNFDVRKVKWNMTIEEVKASEDFEWIEGGEDQYFSFIYVPIEFLDEESYLAYYFNMNRLHTLAYIINEEHSNPTDYWLAFKRILNALIDKYGKANTDYKGEPIWKNNLYKDDQSNWGFAISIGHMEAYANWETDNSEILLGIKGDNYDIDLRLQISAKDFQNIEKEKVSPF